MKRIKLAMLGLALSLMATLAMPLAAQETRTMPEGHTPPPATIEQMDWLIGQWVGTGIGDAPAMESWLPASGNTMVGTFVQETSEGGIRFTEHLYLMEEEGSLVLKLKHFNADLTGWEDKEGMVTFPLIALEDGAAYFRSLTLRTEGDDGLLAAVRMKSEGEEIRELVFRFDRVSDSTPSFGCDGKTLEMNDCMAELLEQAQARQESYLQAALKHTADRPELAEMIRTSDSQFNAYRAAECGAVWDDWKEGTIRTVMALSCSIGMTDARTLTIWGNWLTYMDSTPPILPRPAPTR